ncbi:MAG: hypothetical protein GY864_12305 [Desulfobacterales bacterium]|nr:hypothetical protein [Desulfobacterales bacterium]
MKQYHNILFNSTFNIGGYRGKGYLFSGTGKPEPLKHELSGRWSKRIDQKHSSCFRMSLSRFWGPLELETNQAERMMIFEMIDASQLRSPKLETSHSFLTEKRPGVRSTNPKFLLFAHQ